MIDDTSQEFINRHVGPSKEDQLEMLDYIGFNSLKELIKDTVPENILLKEDLKVDSSLSESEIKQKTSNLKAKVQNGSLNLEKIIPESFALVRESAKRTLGERHYNVQLAGGLILNKGKIAEMKTGEGKTLVSTLPAFLNSLSDLKINP